MHCQTQNILTIFLFELGFKLQCLFTSLRWRVSKLMFAHAVNDHFQFEGNKLADSSKQPSNLK